MNFMLLNARLCSKTRFLGPEMRSVFFAATAIIGLISSGPSYSQSHNDVKQAVGLSRVADNVYMLDTDTSQFQGGNIAVLVGSDGVLLVDSNSETHTSEVVAALKGLSNEPVKYVINTHCHGDHTGGNAVFQRAGATIIASVNVRRRLEQNKCDKIDLGLPTITFDSQLTVHIDGEDVTAITLPTGHTDGDAIVYFKNANVVHTGDAFVSINLPFHSKYAGGNILGVANSLRKIVELVPADAKVIPGHGPQATVSDIKRAITILDAMEEAVSKQVAKGSTLDELKTMGVLSRWKGALGPGDEDFYLKSFYEALIGTPPDPQFQLSR